ncbi:hypothetical protein CRE_29045 [Caenorhabditis remanei]|uniref:Uncharacterized protein n=1 Tax=Caenorhabditis remanei TaxID=31234 RepID=E3NA65_CAERE|nr:hypothetical protein CRE_29045 [Caenorhabditis remanei]
MSTMTREEEDELLMEEDDDPLGTIMPVEEEEPASKVIMPRIPKKKPRSDLEKKLDEAQKAIDRRKEEQKKKDEVLRAGQAKLAAEAARRAERRKMHNQNYQRGRRVASRNQNRFDYTPPVQRIQMPRNLRDELLDRLHDTFVGRWMEPEIQRNRDDSPPNRGGMSWEDRRDRRERGVEEEDERRRVRR